MASQNLLAGLMLVAVASFFVTEIKSLACITCWSKSPGDMCDQHDMTKFATNCSDKEDFCVNLLWSAPFKGTYRTCWQSTPHMKLKPGYCVQMSSMTKFGLTNTTLCHCDTDLCNDHNLAAISETEDSESSDPELTNFVTNETDIIENDLDKAQIPVTVNSGAKNPVISSAHLLLFALILLESIYNIAF